MYELQTDVVIAATEIVGHVRFLQKLNMDPGTDSITIQTQPLINTCLLATTQFHSCTQT
jgi:hypothetical protein